MEATDFSAAGGVYSHHFIRALRLYFCRFSSVGVIHGQKQTTLTREQKVIFFVLTFISGHWHSARFNPA